MNENIDQICRIMFNDPLYLRFGESFVRYQHYQMEIEFLKRTQLTRNQEALWENDY